MCFDFNVQTKEEIKYDKKWDANQEKKNTPSFSPFAKKKYSNILPPYYLLPLFSLLSFIYALIAVIINLNTLYYSTEVLWLRP